jgi:uncharacterized protein YdaU (DUF1376 family)
VSRKPAEVRADVMHSFPIHVGDWIGSALDQTLSPAGEHAYLRLCLNQWKNEADGLPEDPKKLRMFTKLTPREWKPVWEALEPYFPVCPDGKRRNPRTEKEYRFCLDRRESMRERGVSGAKARWEKPVSGDAQALLKHCLSNGPSPSPSPTQIYRSSTAVKKAHAPCSSGVEPRARGAQATPIGDVIQRMLAKQGAA